MPILNGNTAFNFGTNWNQTFSVSVPPEGFLMGFGVYVGMNWGNQFSFAVNGSGAPLNQPPFPQCRLMQKQLYDSGFSYQTIG